MNFLIVFREKITKLELEKTELLEELEELREKVHTKTETLEDEVVQLREEAEELKKCSTQSNTTPRQSY